MQWVCDWLYLAPMPQAFDPTIKATVESLYLQGIPPSRIARKLGLKQSTVATWAKRGGWPVARDKSTALLQSEGEKGIALKIAQESARIRLSITSELSSATKDLSRIPSGRKTLSERVNLIAGIVQSASKVLGWDQTSAHLIAHVDMGSIASAPVGSVIDIEPESEPKSMLSNGLEQAPEGEAAPLCDPPLQRSYTPSKNIAQSEQRVSDGSELSKNIADSDSPSEVSIESSQSETPSQNAS